MKIVQQLNFTPVPNQNCVIKTYSIGKYTPQNISHLYEQILLFRKSQLNKLFWIGIFLPKIYFILFHKCLFSGVRIFMVGLKYVSPKIFYVGNCIFILRSWVLFLSEIPLFLELRSSHRTQNMHYKVYHRNNSHSNPLTYKYIKFMPNTVFPHIKTVS